MLLPTVLLRSALRGLLLCGLIAGGGCAPVVQHPGPPVATPLLATRHFATADGSALLMQTWQPPAGQAQAVLIALHGFNDYSHFFAAAGEFLSQRGILCYAYDQRGFGRAPGRGFWFGTDTYTDDLRSVAEHLRRRHPGLPLYVLGESMGGAIALAAATATSPLPVDGLILSAPAVWGRATMPWWQVALLETTAHTLPTLRLTGSGLKVMASDNIDMLIALGRDPLVIKASRVDAMYGLVDLMDTALNTADKLKLPTLVLYGAKDQIVPRPPIDRLLAKLPAATTRSVLYPDGYHLLLRDKQAAIPLNDIAAWIIQPHAALPSGAEQQALRPAIPACRTC